MSDVVVDAFCLPLTLEVFSPQWNAVRKARAPKVNSDMLSLRW